MFQHVSSGKRQNLVFYLMASAELVAGFREVTDESLYPNTTCPTLRVLDRESTKKAAEIHDPKLKLLDGKIANLVGV